MNQCPCGSGKDYNDCCQIFHEKSENPSTAEQCMRARYSAFVKKEMDFLKDSYNPTKIDEYDTESTKNWAENSEWQGLEIVRTEGGQKDESSGVVEFISKYSNGGSLYTHHEVSTFSKLDDKWYFMDGNVQNNSIKRSTPKVGRNDPCPCGSGKKYKKCCL